MADTLVIIPTYNEKENIAPISEAILVQDSSLNILFVDDHSPDGTQDEIRNAMERFPGRIFLLSRSGKLGLGTAYIAGFKWALERNYEFIFEMDSDFSHDPKDVLRLKQRCLGIVKEEKLKIGLSADGYCRILPTFMFELFFGLTSRIPPPDLNVIDEKPLRALHWT
jgi:glycosyltransferase involved in cell wall biosynthesis